MNDNEKQDEETASSCKDVTDFTEKHAPRKTKGHKRGITALCIVVVVLLVACGGFIAWVGSPDYCTSCCHTPLGSYVTTTDQNADSTGVDKWGNDVSDTTSMLAVTHRDWNAANCETCHPQDLNRRTSEFFWWVAGDYYYPLEEWSYSDMVDYYGVSSDEMCLNENCHNMTRDDLLALTNNVALNPHSAQHGEIACGSCHKAHRASVMYCAKCHKTAVVPEGWITPDEEKPILRDAKAALYNQ